MGIEVVWITLLLVNLSGNVAVYTIASVVFLRRRLHYMHIKVPGSCIQSNYCNNDIGVLLKILILHYRSEVVKLNYLEKCCRPDIAYATHQCACFSVKPKRKHAKHFATWEDT